MVAEKDLKTPAFENSQPQSGSFYGADNSNYSRNYYQVVTLTLSVGIFFWCKTLSCCNLRLFLLMFVVQDSASTQVQHGVSGIQYPESYQQQFDPRYGRGYGAPTPPQQPQQPNLFVPPQATQVPQSPQVYYHIISCYIWA